MVLPRQHDSMLETLYATHQGFTLMNACSKASVFWPGITAQIQHYQAT